MFKRILIANRGEIARRIQQTCKRLGIETVAVYSDADAGAGFVERADQAFRIGAAPAAESYLDIDRIVAAAIESGADAIHPGYGFLAENAAFAAAVTAAGLTFIGPAAETMALMGSKIAAKNAMEAAGVPCVPGYHGEQQDDATLAARAGTIGYPVLIKASAGGGGKGMRVVHAAHEFAAGCEAARREAQSAFGDSQLLLEKFIERPRHIEVQVFGDNGGRIVHLFERECSVQRRYQKIIEEAPSPFVDDALRGRITSTAVRAAEAVGYQNAGTVEFIVTADGEFYFMEMNTRLQVEHPVTELICGVDLVEWQLRVAAGEPLPADQDAITMSGHAIEARVYAEDPFQDFLPSTGTIDNFVCNRRGGLRVDSDLRDGHAVSMFYDPMIAKLSVYGRDRGAAIARLATALDDTTISGPKTNLPLLRRLARHPDFEAAAIDTGYLDRQLANVLGDAQPETALITAAALAQTPDQSRVWGADGWQANGQCERRFAFLAADGSELRCVLTGSAPDLQFDDGAGPVPVTILHRHDQRLTFRLGERQHSARVRRYTDLIKVQLGDVTRELRAAPLYSVQLDGTAGADHPGAPMPGRIVKIHVTAGDHVDEGQPLVVLEGMKMEFTVTAAVAGTVDKVLFVEGDQVDAEIPLVDLLPATT